VPLPDPQSKRAWFADYGADIIGERRGILCELPNLEPQSNSRVLW
jgi:hypothetical protein